MLGQLVADMPSSQFLQVPKVLPHRKSRSRSKSRPREAVAVEEVTISPKTRPRLQSPPMPAVDYHMKPQSPTQANGYTNGYSFTNGKHSDTYTNGYTTNGTSHMYTNGHSNNGDTGGTSYDDFRDLNGDMYTLEDCTTPPPPEPPLRERVVGAWKLESYIAYPTPQSPIQRPTYPMTKNVTGFIMYTPDGYMSAQMLIPGQQSFKRGEGEEPQWAEAGKRFFGYCGPYYISNEGMGREEVLRHTFQVCNLPGWIGDVQVRTHRFEEDGQVLVLGSEEPTEIKVCSSLCAPRLLLACCERDAMSHWQRRKCLTPCLSSANGYDRATAEYPYSNGGERRIIRIEHLHRLCRKSRFLARVSRDLDGGRLGDLVDRDRDRGKDLVHGDALDADEVACA